VLSKTTLVTGLAIAAVALSNCYPISASPMLSPNPAIGGTGGVSTSDQQDEKNDKPDGAASQTGAATPPTDKSDGVSVKRPKQLGRVMKHAFGVRTAKDTIHSGTTGRRVIGVESPRDMNIFALEPTIIDEGWYASGKSERHQNIPGTTNEIVTVHDNDKPTYPMQVEETKSGANGVKPAPTKPAAPN